MLELYHNINSVCAQKIRLALAEKGLDYKEYLLALRRRLYAAQSQRRRPWPKVRELLRMT